MNSTQFLTQIEGRLDGRLNKQLLEMKPEYDDSITGFNEAWDIMRKLFAQLKSEQTENIEAIPHVSMQMLIDAGLNAFGLQLFVESIGDKKDAKTFKPLSFIFRGIKITIEPILGAEIDTRHH